MKVRNLSFTELNALDTQVVIVFTFNTNAGTASCVHPTVSGSSSRVPPKEQEGNCTLLYFNHFWLLR